MGILKGLIFAVGLTLIALMWKLSTVHDSVLGRLADSEAFVDVRHQPEARQFPGLLIFRPNGILFFANANRVHNHLRQLVKSANKTLQAVLINLEASPEIDATSLEMLEQLRSELEDSGMALCFARVSDEVRDLFDRSGFLERLGEDKIFPGVHSGVNEFLKAEQPALAAAGAG